MGEAGEVCGAGEVGEVAGGAGQESTARAWLGSRKLC